MIVVRAATMEEWHVLRDIRLAALQDAPNAFGSSYAEQAASLEADWRRRISRGRTFFAFVPDGDGTQPAYRVRGNRQARARRRQTLRRRDRRIRHPRGRDGSQSRRARRRVRRGGRSGVDVDRRLRELRARPTRLPRRGSAALPSAARARAPRGRRAEPFHRLSDADGGQ